MFNVDTKDFHRLVFCFKQLASLRMLTERAMKCEQANISRKLVQVDSQTRHKHAQAKNM